MINDVIKIKIIGTKLIKIKNINFLSLRLILRPFFRSPLKGAESIIYLATKQDDGVTGEYFVDSKIHKSSSYSKNLEEAHKLWSLSEEMVGQTFDL